MCSSKMSCMAFRLVLWQVVIPDQMSNFSLSGSSNKTCGRQGWKIQVRQDQEKRCFYRCFYSATGPDFRQKHRARNVETLVTSRWHHGVSFRAKTLLPLSCLHFTQYLVQKQEKNRKDIVNLSHWSVGLCLSDCPQAIFKQTSWQYHCLNEVTIAQFFSIVLFTHFTPLVVDADPTSLSPFPPVNLRNPQSHQCSSVFISCHQCSSKAKPKEITRHTKEELGETNVAKALHCSRHELDILDTCLATHSSTGIHTSYNSYDQIWNMT